MSLTILTPPVIEPVTPDDAQDWLGLADPSQDDRLARLIKRSREYVETVCQRSLLPQTWTLRLDHFPAYEIRLPRPPLQSVTTIKYYDIDDALQTLSAALYEVDIFAAPARALPVDGETWPSTFHRVNAVEIEYLAGYADPDDMPETLREAILMLVDHWYEHRGAVTELRLADPPITVQDILWPYRVW